MQLSAVRFKGSEATLANFLPVVRQRVDAYFQENKIGRHANAQMYLKTAIMIAIYFTPYFLMISGTITAGWALLLGCLVMGIGMAGIGMGIMHDANHGAYSSNPRVNEIMGHTLNLVGGHAFNWKVQHNVLHHTYTNIEGIDEDLKGRLFFCFSPNSPRLKFHRFQHIYAFFIYGLMTLTWTVGVKDYMQTFQYGRRGMPKLLQTSQLKQVIIMLITKVVYIGYIAVIPMMVMEITWYQWLAGFLLMHFVAGVILATVTLLAHLVEEVEHVENPGDSGLVPNIWAVHEMETTANFATANPLVTWYTGGLNHQVEHHLFPTVCHVHYPKISRIVQETAREFGVPYNENKTIFLALRSHVRTLHALGTGKKKFKAAPTMAAMAN